MAQIKYVDNGTSAHIIKHDVSNIKDNLPPGLWKVAFNPMTGFYLTKELRDIELPEHIFGSSKKQLELITSRFERDNKSMGVLLTGDKGTGKTLLASQIINHYVASGFPVILMDEAFEHMDSAISTFISQISNAVFLFDEFEKVFSSDAQQYLLNFFDEKSNMNRLSIAISNNQAISEFMLSRPSRFFYHFKYGKLDNDTITEVVTYYGLSKSVADALIIYKERLDYFGYDILISIIDELQFRNTENVAEVIETMNIDLTEYRGLKKYEATELVPLSPNKDSFVLKDIFNLKSSGNALVIELRKLDEKGNTLVYDRQLFSKTKVVNYNPSKNEFTYQVDLDEGDQKNLYIIRIVEKELDYKHYVY